MRGMKSVLISTQPQWCELIASGKKTVEVRKTAPKIATPFKVYIYCTNGDNLNYLKTSSPSKLNKFWVDNKAFGCNVARANGKVIGEFVCDRLEEFTPTEKGVSFKRFSALHDTCLSVAEIRAYLSGKVGYGWHISDLVIYDKPKKLSEFGLKRPPQSWCYVEEVQTNDR